VAKLPDRNRQNLIRGLWADRGLALWKARTVPGSLVVDLKPGMRAPAPPGRAIHLPKSLTFELRSTTVKGKTVNQIVCEGVVVEKDWK
jgi:hypothetical protein